MSTDEQRTANVLDAVKKSQRYEQAVIALQRAKEQGDVRVTTEEAGLVIAHHGDNDDILLSFNHLTEQVDVHVYDGLDLKEIHRDVAHPFLLATELCEKYRSQ